MGLRTLDCPLCENPVQGPYCENCDINHEKADTVQCKSCGDKILKENAGRARVQDQRGMPNRVYVCKGGCGHA